MKITEIRADTLRTGATLVRVFTDAGIVGISEVGWRNAALFRIYLDDRIRQALVGEDPLLIDRHWERLFVGTYENWIPVPLSFVGAIDIALWDIAGQAAGQPLHRLLGGAARMTIPLYWSVGSGWKRTPEEMLERVQAGLEAGFRAFKIRMDWGPLRRDADPAKDLATARLVRASLPAGVPLGFDANNGYSVGTAIRQGRAFEELGLAWFEEPLAPYDLRGLRQVVDALDIPVSSGEQETTRWRFRDLIELANPDILQPDLLESGGISECLRIFELAAVHGKPVMPHSPAAGILSVASLHAYATVRNAIEPHEYSTEFGTPPEEVADLFVEPILQVDGSITLSDRPGLGLTLDERGLARLIAQD